MIVDLGLLLFHEAVKKKDTKDWALFSGLVSAWGDVNEQVRKFASTPLPSQQEFDFDEDEETRTRRRGRGDEDED